MSAWEQAGTSASRAFTMSKLLYIESSPRQGRSHTAAVAHVFLEAYRDAHPDSTVDTWDLWSKDEPLVEFDGAAITAKYAVRNPGYVHTPEEAQAWATIDRSIDRLRAADLYVLGVPMWNYGPPYKFKHLVDVVTQPGLTTIPARDGKPPVGLLTGRRAVVVSARGGFYTAGGPRAGDDMVIPYVTRWLRLIGVDDVHTLLVEGQGLPDARANEERAKESAKALAASL